MKHSTTVVFALFASLLVVTAMPATVEAASGQLVVGSQHTDFGTGGEASPQTLDNLSVEGSGDDATVNLDIQQHSVTRPADGQQFTLSDRTGLKIQPNQNINELSFDTSSNTAGATTAYVTYTNGTVIQSSGISGGTASFSDLGLKSGESYYLLVDAGGSDYTRGAYESANYPYSGEALDITAGVSSGGESISNAYSVNNVSATDIPPSEATYVSAVHGVSNAEQAAVNITEATNVSIDAEVRTDGGTVLNQTTLTGTGNHTLALSSTSSGQLETVLNVTTTGDDPQFELADESVLFHNEAPAIDNSSASPTGDITQQDIQLSVNVSDPQFGSAQGDELTATFYVDGESVGTDTVTSNSTASVDYTASTGGSHSWYVVVNDSYGASTTSDTFEFRAPSELRIYNESNPSELLDNATITLQFYGDESTNDPFTVTKTVTDGTANLSGLPANQPFVVVASADGFHDRRIFLSSLYDQQEIYLLPTSKTIVQPTYVLEDFSGYYPSENSVLAVQREINGTYQTVVGDYFGATGEFEATLEEGVRHRLVIMNTETGRSRPLGTTMASDSASKIVRVLAEDEIELVTGDNRAPIVGPSLSTLPAAATDISISTYANDSQSYDVTVTYENESVSDTLATKTVSGNSEADVGIDLSDRSGGSVWVNITWTTAEGNTATKSVEYAVSKVYVGSEPLLHWVGLIPGEFGANAGAITSFMSVMLTLLMMGVVGQTARPSGQVMGLVGLAGLASFAVIGWLSYDVLFASTVGYFGIIAIREGL